MTLRKHVMRIALASSIGVAFVGGCTSGGRPSVLPNPDKSLRRSSAQFAADAAKRHPYKSDAPQGGDAPARAQVGYMLDQIELVNLSGEDWSDVEVWVNQAYVVHVPQMKRNELKVLAFRMIYDEKGNYLPTSRVQIKTIELLRDGKMYNVRFQLAD